MSRAVPLLELELDAASVANVAMAPSTMTSLAGAGPPPHGGGRGGGAPRTPANLPARGGREGRVQLARASFVAVEQRGGGGGGPPADGPVSPHLGVVPDPAEQPVGDPRGPPG